MPNLFPEDTNLEENNIEESLEEPLEFKGSYLFDFEKGEFTINPDGTVAKCDDLQAYIQWCQIAMLTDRYKYVFSNLFGQEFRELKKSSLSRDGIELEIKRIIQETLLVHPRTRKVNNFNFNWSDNKEEVYCEFQIITIDDEKITLDNNVKVR
ncbi:DUF2634 domain-containing protein [Clostridium tetani]|uniref:DUF2634 domain-containing protein n=1 Tax=Clostridium tetani TaxID=1513 RepID=A0ABC8EBK1_CLOTA|nr:DUF2634 domain-containing protein [Clostridium tetani]BDR81013.1 hypothetical protein K234311028_12590 [Clostridium tetani]